MSKKFSGSDQCYAETRVCPGTQGDNPNNLRSALKHLRIPDHGKCSDPHCLIQIDKEAYPQQFFPELHEV